MNGSTSTGGFGPGNGFDGVWQAMEQLRSTFDKRVGTRVGKGEVRTAVLALLTEQPMHGYQIIREIEERSGGSWKPSAGSVYPTLQLLADEALITAEENNGRKIYSLTDAGRVVAGAETSSPWESTQSAATNRHTALPKAGVELAQATAQLNRTGTPEQVQEAVAILDDARRRIYSILAQE
jgi:DNA-binding PadR family transcriptional regulator